MRLPDPIANTTTEAYLAYKAGVLAEGDLKPKLYDPYIHLDAWLAYWTGLVATYPTDKNGNPEMLTDEEAYIAYLSGVTDTYPEEFRDPADIRVAAYFRYLISARWGRPEYPVNNEELYLSMLKTQYIPSGDPSSDIVIDGSTKAPFVDVKMYGDTYQQSYDGKNILSIAFNALDQGITTTHNPDGTLTLRGTCTAPYSNISNRQPISLPAGTYTLSTSTTHPKFGVRLRLYEEESGGAYLAEPEVPKNGSSRTFTLGSDIKSGYIWLSGTSEGLEIDETIGIQLEAGSEASSFEPYVGGIPSPNPDYPQEIQTVTGRQVVKVTGEGGESAEYEINLGKNLFDIATASDVWINESGISLPNIVWRNSDFIKVEPNTTYALSGSPIVAEHKQFQYHEYSSNNESSYINQYAQINGVDSITFTTHTGCKYIRVGYRSDVLENVQLELGSTATSYAPYFTPIELCKLGGYQDYIWKDGESWKLHKATHSVTLTGAELWQYPNVGSSATFFQLSDKNWELAFGNGTLAPTPGTIESVNPSYFKSPKFYGIDAADTNMKTYQGIGKKGGFFRIALLNTWGVSTVEQLKTWLEQNNVEVTYVLATATDTVITDQNLINQLNALKQGGAEEGTTYIKVSATDPNLPGLLYVEAPKYD